MSQICGTKVQIIETRLEIGCKIMTEVASSMLWHPLCYGILYAMASSMLWQHLCYGSLYNRVALCFSSIYARVASLLGQYFILGQHLYQGIYAWNMTLL